MRKWHQKTLLGVSLKVVAPTGQYDPTKLINLGANRWAFKPELGLSRRWGHWVLDAYGGVVALHREPGVLLAQRVRPGRSGADPGPGRRPRDPPELRLSPAAVGVARRQLLARRHDEPERRRKPGDAAAELARGDHGIRPRDASPVAEAQLRPRRLHPVRRRLPGALGRVAVLVDQRSLEAEYGHDIEPGDFPSGVNAMTSAKSRAGSKARDADAPPRSRAERYAAGKALRATCPRESHAALEGPCRPARRRRARPGGGEGTRAGPPPPAPRAHGPLGVHVLPRGGSHDGGRPGRRRRPAASAFSAAGMRTCATSAGSPRRSAGSSSRSTTSTRRCRGRGNGTSSASPPASSWPAGTTG